MSRVSASRLGLLKECGYWARPDVARVDVEAGDAARDGTALHALAQMYIELGGDDDPARGRSIIAHAADPTRVERLAVHLHAWIAAHVSPAMRAEVPFAWDPVTDMAYELAPALAALGLSGPRAYAKPADWASLCAKLGISEQSIPGTADLVELIDGGRAVVYDWCAGSTQKLEQLRGLGLMVARTYRVDDVRMVTLRVDESGVTEQDHGTMDAIDLAELAGELGARIELVPSSEPTPGAHCVRMYCPAYLGCPTTQAAVAALIPAEKLTKGASPDADRRLAYRMSVDIESVEHAAWLLPRVNLLRDAAEALRDALKGWAAEHGGVPSAPGKIWGPTEVERKSFSREKAEALLRLLGASDEQLASCMTTTTITQYRDKNEKTGRGKRAA